MNEIRVHNKNIINLLIYCFQTAMFVSGCVYVMFIIVVNFNEISLGHMLISLIGLLMIFIMLNRLVYYIFGSFYSLSINDNTFVYNVFRIIHVEFLVSDIKEVKYLLSTTFDRATNDYDKEKWLSSELILIIRKGLKRSILISQRNVSSVEFMRLKERLLKIKSAKQSIHKSAHYSTLIYGTKF